MGGFTLAAGERATLIQADALALTLTAPAPDIVFIDPPFAAQLHAGALAAVIAQLRPNARIYLEYPAAQGDEILAMLADRAHVLRQKRAGQVGYCLAQPRAASEDDGASSIS